MEKNINFLDKAVNKISLKIGSNKTGFILGFIGVTCFFISNQSIKTN
jgi:hypothetical protein